MKEEEPRPVWTLDFGFRCFTGTVTSRWALASGGARVCVYYCGHITSCSRGGRGIVEDMCYERRRAEAGLD
jgi:hypothetical protein